MQEFSMILEKITNMVVELEIDEIARIITLALDENNISPFEIIKALKNGMDEVGRRYENMEYYLTELMLAGETIMAAFEVLKPRLVVINEKKRKEKVIICTVKGDHHDIGKNLLGTILMSSGFDVIDLGVDVDAATIVREVKLTGASIIALSSLLSMTIKEIEVTHEALIEAGLRKRIKIIVGGPSLNLELALRFGADDYANDVLSGVRHVKKLLKK